MASTPRNARHRRSSLPTMSLHDGTFNSTTEHRFKALEKNGRMVPTLDNISDEDTNSPLMDNTGKRRKSLTVEDLPFPLDPIKRDITSGTSTSGSRRHSSAVTMCSSSSKKSVVKSSTSADIIVRTPRRGSITSISELEPPSSSLSLLSESAPTPRGRRHSVACVGSTKELHSILKKNKKDEEDQGLINNGDSDSTKLAWTEQKRPSTANMDFERDMPEGSDIFRLAMADFLPEEEEEFATKIATVKLKDCDDTELEQEECEDVSASANVRRIRWNEHVDVIR